MISIGQMLRQIIILSNLLNPTLAILYWSHSYEENWKIFFIPTFFMNS